MITTTEGLAYTLDATTSSYSVSGIGTCHDKNIVIPSTYNQLPVTRIENYAFYECSDLISIVILNSVTSIGDWAFSTCSSLRDIILPQNITRIESNTFLCCSSLSKITIPNSATRIGEDAFCGCSNLTSIVIPDSVKSIDEGAFARCSSLTSVTFENTTCWSAFQKFNAENVKEIDVTNAIDNATMLVSTFRDYYWEHE